MVVPYIIERPLPRPRATRSLSQRFQLLELPQTRQPPVHASRGRAGRPVIATARTAMGAWRSDPDPRRPTGCSTCGAALGET